MLMTCRLKRYLVLVSSLSGFLFYLVFVYYKCLLNLLSTTLLRLWSLFDVVSLLLCLIFSWVFYPTVTLYFRNNLLQVQRRAVVCQYILCGARSCLCIFCLSVFEHEVHKPVSLDTFIHNMPSYVLIFRDMRVHCHACMVLFFCAPLPCNRCIWASR